MGNPAALRQKESLRISIAMASCNGERFIGEQLASLAAQTRLPDELVVSDDASTDRTVAIVEEFSRTAPFQVRIHRNQQRLGFSNNFLRCAQMCSGDWIAFCDQDDVWLPQKLAVLEPFTRVHGRTVLLVAHNAHVVDESLKPSGVHYHNTRKTIICSGQELPHIWVASGFTMMFRADLVSRIPHEYRGPDPGIPHVNLGHDVWVSRLARILGDVAILPDNLALYRRHAATTSTFLAGGNQQVRNSRKFSARIRHLSARGAGVYREHARCASHQAAAFGRLAQDLPATQWCEKFRRARTDYKALSKWLLMRSSVYGERQLHRRLRYLLAALLCGGYVRFNGHFSANLKKVIRDLVFDFAIAFYGPE